MPDVGHLLQEAREQKQIHLEDVERELNRMVVDGYIEVDNDEETGVLVYRFGGAASG